MGENHHSGEDNNHNNGRQGERDAQGGGVAAGVNFPQPLKDRSKGGFFLTCVYIWIFLGALGYNITVALPYGDKDVSLFRIAIIIGSNLASIFFVISFAKAATTDPGKVPPHYGFYLGDETKRRRYCKICHVWKPERSHHCSVCQRCVLQMDHHCIWINNCVGFYNRKFFIQLMGYGLLWLGSLIIHGCYTLLCFGQALGPRVYYGGEDAWKDNISLLVKSFILVITLLSAFVMFVSMIPLAKLHFVLLIRNSTTLEDLGGAPAQKGSAYDLGKRRNVEQVLGPKSCLWFWPCHTGISRPIGDGVRWRQDYTNLINNNELNNDQIEKL